MNKALYSLLFTAASLPLIAAGLPLGAANSTLNGKQHWNSKPDEVAR